MSWSYWLYRAPEDSGSPLEWEGVGAEPLGGKADVIAKLERVLPPLAWYGEDRLSASFTDPVYGPGARVFLCMDGDQVVMIWPDNHASPTAIATIMDAFALNFCVTEYMERRFPAEVDRDWNPLPGGRQPEQLGEA